MVRKEEIEERQDDRFRILKIIYELSNGRTDKAATTEQIHKEIGAYSINLIRSLVTYWADRKFVKAIGKTDRARKFYMRPHGIEYMEKELKK
ncbi:MAG TPA: hypothetical protein VJZ68_02160 [Nitrososphaera sp.]|nr:hypothetical protein [Nitrososphaera sp.]